MIGFDGYGLLELPTDWKKKRISTASQCPGPVDKSSVRMEVVSSKWLHHQSDELASS